MNHDYEYGIGISKVYGIHDLWEKVTKEYAEQYGQALLQKVSEEATIKTISSNGIETQLRRALHNGCSYEIDKDSILNTKLDLI